MKSSEVLQDRLFGQLGQFDEIPLLVDAGARGGAFEPWCFLKNSRYRMHGFEPDPSAFEMLNSSTASNHVVHPHALWDKDESIRLHLNRSRATSSVYPLNEDLIDAFPEGNMLGRVPENVVEVPAIRLDSVIDEPFIDQLKIDVHSAEYEVLKGAEGILRQTFCVMIEAWNVEIHKGQHLLPSVLDCMNQHGFSAYHFNTDYMAWPEGTSPFARNVTRRRQVGVVILFFPQNLERVPEQYCIRAAAIADIYGYPGAALQLLKRAGNKQAEALVYNYWRQFKSPRSGRLSRFLRQRTPYIAPVE